MLNLKYEGTETVLQYWLCLSAKKCGSLPSYIYTSNIASRLQCCLHFLQNILFRIADAQLKPEGTKCLSPKICQFHLHIQFCIATAIFLAFFYPTFCSKYEMLIQNLKAQNVYHPKNFVLFQVSFTHPILHHNCYFCVFLPNILFKIANA
jgi:hypothetical protein